MVHICVKIALHNPVSNYNYRINSRGDTMLFTAKQKKYLDDIVFRKTKHKSGLVRKVNRDNKGRRKLQWI